MPRPMVEIHEMVAARACLIRGDKLGSDTFVGWKVACSCRAEQRQDEPQWKPCASIVTSWPICVSL